MPRNWTIKTADPLLHGIVMMQQHEFEVEILVDLHSFYLGSFTICCQIIQFLCWPIIEIGDPWFPQSIKTTAVIIYNRGQQHAECSPWHFFCSFQDHFMPGNGEKNRVQKASWCSWRSQGMGCLQVMDLGRCPNLPHSYLSEHFIPPPMFVMEPFLGLFEPKRGPETLNLIHKPTKYAYPRFMTLQWLYHKNACKFLCAIKLW